MVSQRTTANIRKKIADVEKLYGQNFVEWLTEQVNNNSNINFIATTMEVSENTVVRLLKLHGLKTSGFDSVISRTGRFKVTAALKREGLGGRRNADFIYKRMREGMAYPEALAALRKRNEETCPEMLRQKNMKLIEELAQELQMDPVEWLRETVEVKKASIPQLANRIGMSKTTLQRYLNELGIRAQNQRQIVNPDGTVCVTARLKNMGYFNENLHRRVRRYVAKNYSFEKSLELSLRTPVKEPV